MFLDLIDQAALEMADKQSVVDPLKKKKEVFALDKDGIQRPTRQGREINDMILIQDFK